MSVVERLRVGMVAGEPSGDILGAGLIEALRAKVPNLQIEGVGGPRMQAAGLKSLEPMNDLTVGGLVEVIKRLPRILAIRYNLKKHFLKNPPDIFIGIDAPDFNLPLEKYLKENSIKTVHYVSPTVWAWRPKRIFNIKKSVDLMLSIFPFEGPIYRQHQIPYVYVGHPLADEINPPPLGGRGASNGTTIALLPGSRTQEIERLAPLFFETAEHCLKKQPNLQFVLPTVSKEHTIRLQEILKNFNLPINILEGQSKQAFESADVVLTASGTATLECLLHRKPMVVAYKMAPLTYFILKRMITVPYVSMPNLLANKPLVPEFIQEAAEPFAMSEKLLELLHDNAKQQKLLIEFEKIHQLLRQNASEKSCDAVLHCLNINKEQGKDGCTNEASCRN